VDQFLSLTIIGLSTGAVYAIGASGLVLTYTTTGIFNFAHGAIGMFGAFLYWQIRFDWGVPTPLALFLVLFVFSPLLGIALELVVMRNLQGTAESTRLVITISLLAATIGAANWIWEPGVSRPMDRFFQGEVFEVGPTTMSYHEAITIAVAIGVAVGLRFLLFSTRIGVAMRASVDDRPLAEMNGAKPDAAAMLAWSIGCSSATLAGILIAPSLALSVPVLSLLIVNAYAAAMIGRLRSLPMTFLGAIIVGLVDAYLIGYQPDTAYLNGLRAASPVVILFIALMLLPQTRLRTGGVVRSREWFPRPTPRGALIFAAVVFGGAVAIAPMLNSADSITAARVFAFGLIILSFVPLIGFAGQVSLCQLSFAGIGAVTMAHLGQGGNPLGLVAAVVVTAAVGALISLPALRVSGIYLALATAAFAVMLDRWIFLLPDFEVFGLFEVKLFGQGSATVDRLELGPISTDSPTAQLILLSGTFALMSLVVVGIRRSAFGERLLAMKTSEAACATLGLDLTMTKVAVFSLSAGIAGLGGAMYGGLLKAVNPTTFDFIAGLPMLLLGVVGGIGAVGGALFGGIALGAIPIIGSTVNALQKPMLVTPGLMGIGLGRDPNGAVSQMREGFGGIPRSRPAFAVLVAGVGGSYVFALTDVISGWTLIFFAVIALLIAAGIAGPLTGERPSMNGRPTIPDLEWAGLARPFTEEDRETLDHVLAIDTHGALTDG
jgi:branched-chain amino acid transport system permease protein